MYELKIILLYGTKFSANIKKIQLPNISQRVLNGTTQENGNTRKLWII